MSKFGMIILAAITLFLIFGIGVYNRIVSGDETVTSSWSEVVNQYQRRADLIPNPCEHRKRLCRARKRCTNQCCRSASGSVNWCFESFIGELLNAYPDLKSDKNFLELQTQLEGTENRVTVARKRYIDAVRDYNLTVRKFPGNIIAGAMGYSTKPNFSVANEDAIAAPPKGGF
ncbi:Protein LemA [Nymphon striatum]|nr:Protein LemA [Nymphon striatum]